MYRISIILIAISALLTLSMSSLASITGATATTGVGGRAAKEDMLKPLNMRLFIEDSI